MSFDYEDELGGPGSQRRAGGSAGDSGSYYRQTGGNGARGSRAPRPAAGNGEQGSRQAPRPAGGNGAQESRQAPRPAGGNGAQGSRQAPRPAAGTGARGGQAPRPAAGTGAQGSRQAPRPAAGTGEQGSRQAPEQAAGYRAQGGQAPRPAAGYGAQDRQQYSARQPEERRIKTRRAQPEEISFSDKVAQLREEVNRKKKRRRRIIAMIVAECLVLTCIFSYAYVSRLWNLMPKPNVNKENVENPNIPLESINKMQGYWMVAIFGVDSGTGTSSSRGNSSDVNMIACVNQDTGEIKLVSLYRDTYLKVNDKGTYRKFNYAYSEGGPEQALKMLNENLDLNITEYIIFNWKAVADGINILGGVDMEITKSEFKYINAFITETVQETGVGSHQLKSAGMNHLDGIQAVAYGRLRLMDSDYQRVERQKKVIEAAFAKAKNASYSVLNNILYVCLQEVMTNLDFADLTNAALNVTKYHIGDTAGFPFEKSEANMGKARGSCIIPQSLASNVSQLHQFLFGDENYEPTSAVKSISDKISSDSGTYAVQSRPSSAAETQTAGSGSTEEESGEESESETRETETDENGMIIAPQPGIGETDENGDLIDGPEPDDPNEFESGYILPSPGSPDNNVPSGGPGASQMPGTGRNPGDSQTGSGPGAGNAQTPNGNTGSSGAGGNTGVPSPGGNTGSFSPGGVTPSGGAGSSEVPGIPGDNSSPVNGGPGSSGTSGGSQDGGGTSGGQGSGSANGPSGPGETAGGAGDNGIITGPGDASSPTVSAGPG